MVNVQIKGISAVQGKLIDLPKQVRFATMLAINDTAKIVQKHEVEKVLPANIILRGHWWKPGTRLGINIGPFATKTRLSATVGSKADWLKLIEEGGVKKPSGHRLAIEAGARPTERALLAKAIRPRQLLRRAGDVRVSRRGRRSTVRKRGAGFIITTKGGAAIFVREAGELKRMYSLEPSARISPILKFFESGQLKVNEVYQAIFDARLKHAIATARPIRS